MSKESKFLQFWKFFIDNSRFTFIIILTILAVGIYSLWNIPIESEPEVDIPVAVVSTPYPGASPAEVEKLVTNPIEDKIRSSISGIDKITSQSRSGSSLITVQFKPERGGKDNIFDLKDKVDKVKDELPDQAEESQVEKVSFEDLPILTLSFSGPYNKEILSSYSNKLQDRLEQVDGVSDIKVIGNLNREIKVKVEPKNLEQYNLSLNQVRSKISDSDVNFPLGSIETAGQNFSIKFSGGLDSTEELSNIPIRSSGSDVITLDEVATIQDGYSSINSISRFADSSSATSSLAITLNIFKNSQADIVSTINRVQQEIDSFKQEQQLQNATLVAVDNKAERIKSDIGELGINSIQTIIIVAAILLLIFGLRESILASLAIPFTFLVTFSGLYYFGFTLNILTLFSLILSLGILVDSAVVVTEALYTQLEKGKSIRQAALTAISNFQYPLLTGVLTTVFAFLPMLLVSGIMGEFIQAIPITLSISLLTSLFVALGLVTTLSVVFVRKFGRNLSEKNKLIKKSGNLLDQVTNFYENYLNKLISNPKQRLILYGSLVILFIGSIALPLTGLLSVNMFPPSNEDTIYIDATLSNGSTLQQTDQTLAKIEQEIKGDNFIKNYSVNAGSSAQSGSVLESGSVNNSNLGHLVVQLKNQRPLTSKEIINKYEDKFSNLSADISITQRGAGPSNNAPVKIEITGESLAKLDSIGRQIESQLKQIEGTRNVEFSIETTNGEFNVIIDRTKAELHGVTPRQLSRNLKAAVSNLDTTVIRSNDEDIDIKLELLNGKEGKLFTYGAKKVNVSDLKNLRISSNKGKIPLRTIAEVKLSGSRKNIRHKNGKRVVNVTSYTTQETGAQTIFSTMEDKIDKLDIPDNYQITMGGEREDIQQSFSDLFKAMVLAVFLIAGLMVLQFNSFRQPLMILTTIPLAMIGVLPGLTIIGETLSFPGLIGIVALAGIVVNNAIILIDKINNYRKDGYMINQAITKAVQTRSRPVILTTITTVGGILPLALSNPTWGPLGYSIVFGLTFSTFSTLIVIPLLYRKFCRKDVEGAYIS